MARAAVWMRADSKVVHQLLEALALDAAEQVFGLHFEAVERDLVFLHAAIAQHLDLGAGHAGDRERVAVIAARLLGQQHGQPAIAGLRRIGAHQERHQIGADRMGDPGLVAKDLVDVAVTHRAGLDRGQIGTGVRLGEHRSRQHLAGRDLRQPVALLLVGAAAENELGRDLGAGAERAHADIAARQFLRDHAHRFLAEPHAAEWLGHGQSEHAEPRHVRDDFERDVAVGAVPGLRMLDHFAVGELAHLVTDLFERVVEAGGADRRAVAGAHQLDQARPVLRGVAGRDQRTDLAGQARGNRRSRQAEVGRPHHFALADRNPAERSAPDIRQARCGPAAPRCPTAGRRRACARRRWQAAAPPRRRWRARRAHGWRAARDLSGARPARRRP